MNSDVTKLVPGDGASWIDSPHAKDHSQRVAPGGTASRAEVNDHGSKTLATVALVAACLALGAILMYVALAGELVDAKIQAGAARTETVSHEARVNARIAVDEVERMRTALAAKGILIPKPEH